MARQAGHGFGRRGARDDVNGRRGVWQEFRRDLLIVVVFPVLERCCIGSERSPFEALPPSPGWRGAISSSSSDLFCAPWTAAPGVGSVRVVCPFP